MALPIGLLLKAAPFVMQLIQKPKQKVEPMAGAMKAMFGSKKFIATILGMVVPVLNQAFGWDMSTEQVLTIISPLLTYVVGQGVADFGKGAK